ncbi:MAG: T9SS type B sorting domain-containing protein [Bacteroidota bacterium]
MSRYITNDYFTAYCEGVLDFHMYIFDRWGELVVETTDINQGWDGSVNGSPAKQDVFVYRIDYKIMDYTDVHKYTKYGTVNLIR